VTQIPPGSEVIQAKTSRRTAAEVVSRLKLTEPVRLYLYGVASIVLVGLTVAGVITEEWRAYFTAVAAVVLAVVPSAMAIRATVWSQASHIDSLRRLRSLRDIQLALEDAA
jgi:hypothetical protein